MVIELKRVLVAAPTSKRHFYVFEEYIKALSMQTFKYFQVMLISTDEDEKELGDYVDIIGEYDLKVILDWMPWNPEKNAIVQHLADCRESYRKYAIDGDYDYIFHLDTDTIIPDNGIEELMSFDKDQVSYFVHVYPRGRGVRPAVFKDGGFLMNQKNPKKNGIQYYSWSWYYKYRGKLKKIYATSLGCLLAKRKVFTEVPFRTHTTFINGEDLW